MKKLKPKKKGGAGETEKSVEEKPTPDPQSALVPKETKVSLRKSPSGEVVSEGLVAGWTKKLHFVWLTKTFSGKFGWS